MLERYGAQLIARLSDQQITAPTALSVHAAAAAITIAAGCAIRPARCFPAVTIAAAIAAAANPLGLIALALQREAARAILDKPWIAPHG